MNASTHQQLANFIWKICNLLRGPYKRNEYRKVILPLTVLRRFDCVLADTKQAVLAAHDQHAGQPDTVREQLLEAASGLPFYNTSKLDFDRLLDDPNLLAQNGLGSPTTSPAWTRRICCTKWSRHLPGWTCR